MRTKPITTTLAALALAGLLGACGGSNSGGSEDDVASVSDDDSDEQAQDDEADADEELLDWVGCMRDQGIDIPDPTRDADGNLVIEGPGIRIGGGEAAGSTSEENPDGDEGPDVDPEEMDAAMEACGEPPALGPNDISDEDLQAMQDAALEFAACMRDEGIEDFPDPDFSDMGPGGEPQRRSADDNRGGGGEGGDPDERVVLGPFGEIDLDDPDTAAAFEACQDLLGGPPGEGGGPAGAPPSDEALGA